MGGSRLASRGLAAAAALVAAFAPAAPTGLRLVDAAWCAALAGLVTLAASRARRWPLIWFAGLVAAGSIGSWWALAGVAGLVAALAGVASPNRDRTLGALSGALGTVAMLRMPDFGFHGASALVVAVSIAPLLWSAYDVSPRKVRRRSRRGVAIGAGLLGIAALGLAVPALASQPDVSRATRDTRLGYDALRDGDQTEATDRLAQASADFDAAHGQLSGPWTWPARVVPVLGPHAEALTVATGSAAQVTAAAEEVARSAPYSQVRASAGRVDLATIEAMRPAVSQAADALHSASDDLEGIGSPWLLAPVANAVEELSTEVAEATDEVALADLALDTAPALLGADGERTYLVLFTTPSESRFLGGFSGAYGIVHVEGGELRFEPSTSTGTLRAGIGERDLSAFPEFQTRYSRYNLVRWFQNVTVSPDLPANAEVTRSLYQQATGDEIDGVLVVDPYALAALLEITGPVVVDGLEAPLTADNAARYLLHDQYLDFEGDNAERRDLLESASISVFGSLLAADLPGPRGMADALGDAVAQGRLLFHSFDPAQQALFERLGMDGRFAVEPGRDHLSVRTANANPNKIDWFLHREVTYDVAFDPETGLVETTATVVLRNDAPSSGLPGYVLGNEHDKPEGTNTMYLSIYSPLDLMEARLDDEPMPVEVQSELGSKVYSNLVSVAPGSSATVVLELAGYLPVGVEYHLDLHSQPLVNDDQFQLDVRSADDGWQVRSIRSVGSPLVLGAPSALDVDTHLTVRFGPS